MEKTKVYKFYKPNCPPCYALGRILNIIEIPENIEIINLNVELNENKILAKNNSIEKVPALLSEKGIKIVGNNTKEEILLFFKECSEI